MKIISALLHDEGLRAVVLIVIGFLLSEASKLFADRKERKKAVSSALADLLEVRSHFVGLEQASQEIGNLVGGAIPEHEMSQLRVVLDSMLPKWDELHKRYDQSVTTLAGLDPLLAYQLRSKDFIRPFLTFCHSLLGRDPQTAATMGPIVKTKLFGKVEPMLDEAILKVAKKRSLICWYETTRLLRKQKQLPEEARELLQSIKAAIPTPVGNAPQSQPNAPRAATTPASSIRNEDSTH